MTIEERVEALEKELARAKRRTGWLLAWAILVVVGVVVLFKASEMHEVRASMFTIVDDNGKSRGYFGMRDNRPALVLWDEGGSRVVLGISTRGSRLDLFDKQGKPRVRMGVGTPGSVLLDMCDENGKRIWSAP